MLTIRRVKKEEISKFIELMIASGEWDEWKMNYLSQDWNMVDKVFRQIGQSNGELGEVFFFEYRKEPVGTVYFIRIGENILYMGCRGALPGFNKEAIETIEKKITKAVPSYCSKIVTSPRTYSTCPLTEEMKELGVRTVQGILPNLHRLSKETKHAISLEGPFIYAEFQDLCSDDKSVIIEKGNEKKIIEFIGKHASVDLLEICGLSRRDDYRFVSTLYNKHGLTLERNFLGIINKGKVRLAAAVFHGSIGISASGYFDAAFLIGDLKEEYLINIFSLIKSFYCKRGKRRAFVFLPLSFLAKNKVGLPDLGLKFVKPLLLVSYKVIR